MSVAPRTPWVDLSKGGDNAGVDGDVVLLAAVAEAYGTGGSWLGRPLGAPTRYCTSGSDWRISASSASVGMPRSAYSLALSSWPIPTVCINQTVIEQSNRSSAWQVRTLMGRHVICNARVSEARPSRPTAETFCK
jgi:hypothetical protein